MNLILSTFALFFLLWWIVFLALLPAGLKTQQESGHVVPGTPPSAPHTTQLWRKTLIAAAIAAPLAFVSVLLLRALGLLF